MKSKITQVLSILFIVLAIGLVTYSMILRNKSDELMEQIERQQKLVTDIRSRDSVFAEKTKTYSDVITKYVNNCEFEIGGKKISNAELIRIFNETSERNEVLEDSISILRSRLESYNRLIFDSLAVYQGIVRAIKHRYGISYNFEKIPDGKYIVKPVFSKVDSALLILPYYRQNLSFDSTSKQWKIVLQQ